MDRPTDESNEVEERLVRIFAESRASDDNEHEVQAILASARRQVVVRDLLTFSLVRVWATFLSMTIEFYALFKPRNDKEYPSGEEPR